VATAEAAASREPNIVCFSAVGWRTIFGKPFLLMRLRLHRFLRPWAVVILASAVRAADPHAGLSFDALPQAHFELAGPVGERLHANLEGWLLRAPQANPGMLAMFRQRDREPVPQLVPWAGEFVGKYLISGVQALRLSDDPRLRQQVSNVVAGFIATQAEDGYLGPFPQPERLRGHWDLWGHYHAILALVLWHEQSGDAAALMAARRSADLVCKTYLDTGRRVFDAGDPEMNMAILTGLTRLYRLTGEPRYLRLAHEVEHDWERAGDYLRAGLDGREFYRSPRPRWESLHDLQGLLELWRATGEAKYRDAFVHHWRSIRRWDRRNTGGFSSGEQATGNPYAGTPIETCCTVAWMALTEDYLRLTGDARAADDLELATLNAGLGAQHPSGRWWTYNTPMDGVREASAHTIVFQARAGTPELNCCSVNGPRVLGMLGEWALMSAPDGLVVNWLGSGRFAGTLPDGAPVSLKATGEAWRDGHTELRFTTVPAHAFALRVRIPAWAQAARVRLNGRPVAGVVAGEYLRLDRRWSAKDRLELDFSLPLRFVAGANEAAGKVSLYRGPVLLAFDPAYNAMDETALPAIDLAHLASAHVVPPAPSTADGSLVPAPWLTVAVPTVAGTALRLVDFANAGSSGTPYRSWLPAGQPPPSPTFTQSPPDAARVPAGPVLFRWRGPGAPETRYRLELGTDANFAGGAVWATNVTGSRCLLDTRTLPTPARQAAGPRWWRVVTLGASGETVAEVPPARFTVDPTLPPAVIPAEPRRGPAGEIIAHSLRKGEPPAFGEVTSAKFARRDAEGTEVNGRDQMLVYAVPAWPEGDFSVSLRVRLSEIPASRVSQLFSAWTAGMDDPLRLVLDHGKLFARIEAGAGYSTPGVPLTAGAWHTVAAVKQGTRLTLYLDGEPAGSCAAPEFSNTRAQDCALGGNPHYAGDEFLAARFADFRLFDRALTAEEIRRSAKPK
jgi:DUF1680 family protein